MLKKALAILISVSLLVGALPLFASAEGEYDLRFALASDLHYNAPRETLEGEIDDELFWYSNRRAAMEDESGYIIDEFLRQCAADACEYVLISGDFVDSGRTVPEEHYAVAEKLRAFEEKTGKSVFVIDGNHDLGTGSLTDIADFKTIYADFGYDKALTVSETDCSYTANLGSKYRLIALDSTDPSVSTEDGMSSEKLNWVKAQCESAKADGRYPLLMMHHNLLDHMPLERVFSHNFIVRNHYATAELFADWGIKLVFSGHEHCSDAASYTSALGNVIYDFATTSLTMYPLAYRMFTLTNSEITYEAKTIDTLDTGALTAAVNGYSDEQLALMNSDLFLYSKGFLKAGIQYRLGNSLSMDKIGIEKDAIYYGLVKNAVETLTGLLEMPLTGENSVKSLAAEYNIDFPDTPYKNGWDLATELVSAHYAGEESYTLDSPEVRALLLTVAVILREELSAVSPDVLSDAADAILASSGLGTESDNVAALADSAFDGSVTPAEYFITALLSPLLYEFAFDSDGVNDNNGTLSGYGTVSFAANTANVLENVTSIINKLLTYFKLVMGYVSQAYGA